MMFHCFSFGPLYLTRRGRKWRRSVYYFFCSPAFVPWLNFTGDAPFNICFLIFLFSFFVFCISTRIRTLANSVGSYHATVTSYWHFCGRNRIRTCTVTASTQCSTIGAIRPFVCHRSFDWYLISSWSNSPVSNNVAESVRIELTWVLPQPQLSKPVQYRSVNSPKCEW